MKLSIRILPASVSVCGPRLPSGMRHGTVFAAPAHAPILQNAPGD